MRSGPDPMSIPRLAVFLTVLFGISLSIHFYFWVRLVRPSALPPPWPLLCTAWLALFAIYLPASLILERWTPRSVHTVFSWVTFVWMGFAFLLFALTLTGELVRAARLAASAARWLPGREDPDFLRGFHRAVSGGALGGALLLSGLALFSGLGPVPVKRVRIALPRWPASLSPYTIAQISDLHVGPTLGRRFVLGVVEKIERMKPDLIVITGDLADGSVKELASDLDPLSRLRARDGVYFVTGNHEYYSGVDAWVAFLRARGIRVLRNERVSIGEAGGFDLAGVEDFHAHGPDPEHHPDLPRALAGRDPGRPLILLAHQPRAVVEASSLGVDLQISGHTHGGQIFPFHLIVNLTQPFLAGLHQLGRAHIYVSRGTGEWGPPMRLLAPREITRIELIRDGAGTNM